MKLLRTFLRVPDFLLADLLFFHHPTTSPRPAWWRATMAATLSLLAAGGLVAGLGPPDIWGRDVHSDLSLEIAFNRANCGRLSWVSPVISLSQQLEANPKLAGTALRQVAAQAEGSVGGYCVTVTEPFQNNENSLMLEMCLFLKAAPGMSLKQLGWALQTTRVLGLVVFAVVLLENGVGLAFAAAILVAGLAVLAHLDFKYYSVYPFGPVLVVLLVSTLSLSFQRGRRWGLGRQAAAAAATGWLIAFACNMRTSHLPVYLALLALYFAASYWRSSRTDEPRPRWRRLGWLAVCVASAAAAYTIFGWLLIRPLAADGSRGPRYSYHVIAHPLVLGLAVPDNALARREGIRWDDAVGLTLARRVDPNVEYLHEGYEAALMKYYLGLWESHRDEMLGIYANKLRVAGRDMIDALVRSPNRFVGGGFVRAALFPVGWIPDGAWLLLAYCLLFLAALARSLWNDSPMAFTVALLALASVLLQLEAALVYPVFERSHHSASLLCFLFFVVLAWQLGLEGLRRAIVSGLARRRVAGTR